MRALVTHAVGGGWGHDDPADATERVAVIRGADFPAVAVGDISTVPKRWEDTRKISTRTLEPNDIVLEISGGTSDRPTGRTVFISKHLLSSFDCTVIPASFCRLMRIDDSNADPYYVYWWLQAMYMDGRTWGYQNRSTGIANFQFEYFLDAEIVSLPSIESQRAIAVTLGALDDKIESNRRLSNLLEQEALSYFELWFPPDFNEHGVAISELVNINPSRALKKGEVAPYVGMSELPTNSAIVEGWEQREFGSGQRFRNGDVLMARITPCLENGKTAVVDMLSKGEVGWGSTEYVVLEPKHPFSTPWVYCLTRSEAIRSFAIRNMSGTSGRQRFPASAFDQYRIIEPSRDKIDKFNSIAVPAFEKMAQLRDQNLRLASLRDTLLPELLSGRIRVLDAQEIVA